MLSLLTKLTDWCGLMDRILRHQNTFSKYNRFGAKNNTFLYFRAEMELRNKDDEIKYFSSFIFKAVFYIM